MSDFKIVKLLDPITLSVGGPNFTGAYDNTTTYSIGESVSYLGSSYVAYVSTTGNLPTDTDFWQLLAQQGPSGGDNLVVNCRNNTGSTILKGKVVYITGTTGNKPTIAESQANNETTSDLVIGVTTANVANTANVDVIEFGLLENVDTSAFTEGDRLYLSPTVSGGLTATRPTQPDRAVRIGTVIASSAPNGIIAVNIVIESSLEDLQDVLFTSPQDEDTIFYNSADGLWENKRGNTFESVSKNIKSWDATLTYTGDNLTSVSYTDGVDTIVKTLNYTGDNLTSIVLSGDTPSGIDLTKTLTYTGNNLTGVTYS